MLIFDLIPVILFILILGGSNLMFKFEELKEKLFGKKKDIKEDPTEELEIQVDPIDDIYEISISKSDKKDYIKDQTIIINKNTRDEWFSLESKKPVTEHPLWKFVEEVESMDEITKVKMELKSGKSGEMNKKYNHRTVMDFINNEIYLESFTVKGKINLSNELKNYDLGLAIIKNKGKTEKFFNANTFEEIELKDIKILNFLIAINTPHINQKKLDSEVAERDRINKLKEEIYEEYQQRIRTEKINSIGNSIEDEILDDIIEGIQNSKYKSSDIFDIVKENIK